MQGSDLFDNNGLAHSSTMLNGEMCPAVDHPCSTHWRMPSHAFACGTLGRYSLKQFHFHGKAETRIDAKQVPLAHAERNVWHMYV